MTGLRRIGLALLASTSLVAGCAKEEEDPGLVTLRTQTQEQLEALKKHNTLLNRKLIGINERLNRLQTSNGTLSAQIAFYAAAPDTTKIEIIKEVNRRFTAVFKNQEAFFDTMNVTTAARITAIDKHLQSELTRIEKQVDDHEVFAEFVTEQQDSVNRVFANRIDSRPWYESILGKWEDLEHARQATP